MIDYATIIPNAWEYILTIVYPRFLDIASAPFFHRDMLWIITPLLITLFFIQAYFGRHKDEELGWNSAYANSIMLIFVAINLLKYLYDQHGSALFTVTHVAFPRFLLVLVGFLHAFALSFMDFAHALPKRVAYFLGNAVVINITAIIVIILVYADIPLDRHTLVTALAFLLVNAAFFHFFRWLIPPTPEAERFLQHQEEQHHLKKEEAKRKRQQELRKIDERIRWNLSRLRQKIISIPRKIHDQIRAILK